MAWYNHINRNTINKYLIYFNCFCIVSIIICLALRGCSCHNREQPMTTNELPITTREQLIDNNLINIINEQNKRNKIKSEYEKAIQYANNIDAVGSVFILNKLAGTGTSDTASLYGPVNKRYYKSDSSIINGKIYK